MALGPARRNQSDSNYVNLGRGCAFYSEIDPATGRPDDDGGIDLGNLTELNVSSEDETFEHFSTREGLRTRDVKLIIGRESSINFTIDQTPMELMNLYLSGKKSLIQPTNGLATGGAYTVTSALFPGRWYEIRDANGDRVFGATKADLVVTTTIGANPAVTLTDAQYELMEDYGLMRVRANELGFGVDENGNALPAQTSGLTGSTVDVTTTTPGGILPVVEQIHGLDRTLEGAIRFIQADSRGTGRRMEFMFHKVTLSPSDSAGLISDEPISLSFEGSIEENTLADPDSPFVTVSYLNPVP